MKYCDEFERRLLAGIPYRFRQDVESILQSFHDSRVMLGVYRRAVESSSLSTHSMRSNLSVVAFGSFGRLDGSAALSDFDVVYLYRSSKDVKHVQEIRGLITEIIRHNRALLFDHRSEIEQNTFDFDKSPAYPVIATEELFGNDPFNRTLQVLTEGRVIYGDDQIAGLRKDLLEKQYGYTENVYSLDFSKLRQDLSNLTTVFCTTTIKQLQGEKIKANNRKILKVFALREFFYLATLFAMTEIALAVGAQHSSVEDPSGVRLA
jgi:hypothetical protein